MKTLAVGDVAVPPHLQSLGLERMHELRDPLTVGTGIADKDFAHTSLYSRNVQINSYMCDRATSRACRLKSAIISLRVEKFACVSAL
jgi:hypothetical protein